MKNISRRDFLKGSAATVAGAAALGLLGACSTNDAPAASTTEEKFDKECDFLIVGYGLAGEAAALEGKDGRSAGWRQLDRIWPDGDRAGAG